MNNSNLINNENQLAAVSNTAAKTTNHFSNSNDNYNNKYTASLNSKNNLSVEDMSGGEDELSIASVKGEGFASDLSDTEIRNQHQQHQRTKTKRSMADGQYQQNQKRPTTPMDVRGFEHQTSQVQQVIYRHRSGLVRQANRNELENDSLVGCCSCWPMLSYVLDSINSNNYPSNFLKIQNTQF